MFFLCSSFLAPACRRVSLCRWFIKQFLMKGSAHVAVRVHVIWLWLWQTVMLLPAATKSVWKNVTFTFDSSFDARCLSRKPWDVMILKYGVLMMTICVRLKWNVLDVVVSLKFVSCSSSSSLCFLFLCLCYFLWAMSVFKWYISVWTVCVYWLDILISMHHCWMFPVGA